ncbi:MAG: hypothetical protein RI902_569 [Pseudomonadota bacterium]|jgi:hypothetical protein
MGLSFRGLTQPLTRGQSQFETAICSAAIDLSEFETTYKSTSYSALNPPKALNQDAQVRI